MRNQSSKNVHHTKQRYFLFLSIISFCLLIGACGVVPSYAVDPVNYGQTPLETVSTYPKPSQNRIQLTSYLIFHKSVYDTYKQFLAAHVDYLWFDQSSLSQAQPDGSYSFAQFYAALTELKNLNSALKVGVHGGMIGMLGPYHVTYSYLSESDFLHDQNNVRIANTSDPRVYYVNLGSSTTRQKLVDAWKDIVNTKAPNLWGINFDGYQSYHLEPKFTQGCIEGPCNTKDYWYTNQKSLSQEINAALDQSREVTYNGVVQFLKPELTGYGVMNSEPLAYHDGVLVEHPHTMILSEKDFTEYMQVFDVLIPQQKKVIIWVQPKIISLQHPTFQFTNDLNLERFFLATYLLIQSNPYTYFGYNPATVYDGNNGVFFYKDWYLDYGAPVGSYTVANKLYIRQYAHGIAVVNPTTAPITYMLPGGTYKRWGETEVSGIQTLAPTSGVFFMKDTSVSLCPSDINEDGITDTVDYSLFVIDFLKPVLSNPRSDINGDGMADVADYSKLAQNFLEVCQ